MLDDPKRISELKIHFRIGQEIQYFEPDKNRTIKASVTKFNRTRVLVKNLVDGTHWTIPYYFININQIHTNISNTNQKAVLGRNEVQVKDIVGFIDRNNVKWFVETVRLNQQMVTLNRDTHKWRVHYSVLFKIVCPDIDVLPE